MVAASVRERPRRTALRAARLFDSVTATMRERPTMLIDGVTITDVGYATEPPADAELVDLPDTTLLPGLIDTHVHLAFDASPQPVAALAARDDEQALAAMADAARAAARAGITTVRDLGDRGFLALALRGRPDLPTILGSGPPLTLADGHCHYLGGCVPPGAAAMRNAVRAHAERGVDVVKIMASGGTLTPGTLQHVTQFTVDELRAAVDEAHRLGLPVTTHAHATAAVANALDAGADGLEHVTFWTQDSVESPPALIRRLVTSGTAIGATIGVLPGGGPPPPVVAARFTLILANLRQLVDGGAHVVLGTDGGIGPPKPHDVLPHAVTSAPLIGLPPAAALRAATNTAAQVCGLAGRKGRLAPGHDADVLAVAGDPVRAPESIHDVRAVYLRGTRIR